MPASSDSASSITANSDFYLNGADRDGRVQVIPYGADVSYFVQPPAPAVEAWYQQWASGKTAPIVMLAVQRLAEVKHVDRLIEVVARLESVDPGRFLLVIAGTGPERSNLEDMASQLAPHSVKFVGYVEEAGLPALHHAADLFVSHSMFETFGVMFAQAMASGLPVVAADTSCVAMVVADGHTGVIVEPNDVVGFAEAVLSLANDPQRMERIGTAARVFANQHFRWDAIADQYQAMFESVHSQ